MEKQLSYLNQLDIQRIQEENDSMTVKRKNLFTAFYDVIGKQQQTFACFRFRKCHQNLDRFVMIYLHTLFSIFDSPVRFRKINQQIYILCGKVFFIYDMKAMFCLFSPTRLQRVQQGERDLSLPDIVAGRFADIRLFEVVEDIIFGNSNLSIRRTHGIFPPFHRMPRQRWNRSRHKRKAAWPSFSVSPAYSRIRR